MELHIPLHLSFVVPFLYDQPTSSLSIFHLLLPPSLNRIIMKDTVRQGQAEASESSASPPNEKDEVARETPEHLEVIRTVSRVPGNSHYYEKEGLRTYGDDEDHDHEPPVSHMSLRSYITSAEQRL